jgi:hypothetical protein
MFRSLSCPQCGGALPRQALWRHVECPYCKAVVTRSAQAVQRAAFQQAHARSLRIGTDGGSLLDIGGRLHRVLARLGTGEHSDVLLAQTCGPLPQRVTIKLARAADHSFDGEAATLRALQALPLDGAAYFGQRLPQVVALGRSGGADDPRAALVLRHPNGFSGTLAAVLAHHPHGIADARHAVWLWRRVLEVLAYVHRGGWTHGDLRAEHWLLHAADHGVLLIGWGRARRGGDAARDLMQSAWTIRALLHGDGDGAPPIATRVPKPLADVLRAASEDAGWCARLGAAGADAALVEAARAAFGAPQFVPFDPQRA